MFSFTGFLFFFVIPGDKEGKGGSIITICAQNQCAGGSIMGVAQEETDIIPQELGRTALEIIMKTHNFTGLKALSSLD